MLFDTECGREVAKIEERKRMLIENSRTEESGVILYPTPNHTAVAIQSLMITCAEMIARIL